MTAERIEKLRELAERGIDGEKDNARSMLTKAGIDWRKPPLTFKEKVKKTVGRNVVKEYRCTIKRPSDLLLLATLINLIAPTTSKMQWNDTGTVSFRCTELQSKEIARVFNGSSVSFNDDMMRHAKSKIDLKY